MQAPLLRLPPLLRLHLSRQQQLPSPEAAKQVRSRQGCFLTIEDPVPTAQRQRQDDHIRRRGSVQGPGPRPGTADTIRMDGVSVCLQQSDQLRLTAVAADHPKGLVHPAFPPRTMLWHSGRGGDCQRRINVVG